MLREQTCSDISDVALCRIRHDRSMITDDDIGDILRYAADAMSALRCAIVIC